jgi:hypothetical protein
MQRTLLCVLAFLVLAAPASVPTEQRVRAELAKNEPFAGLKELGPQVLPVLARIYAKSDEHGRSEIAGLFYRLGWKSPEAKTVLMKDVHTPNEALRVNVQYALGRVSSDPDVVDVLSDIMQHDTSPLFRDKAACSLAYDQIHLTEAQKVRLYGNLITALDSTNTQVRQIAVLALKIHTGQDKGYNALAAPDQRQKSVEQWRKWLEEYKRNL